MKVITLSLIELIQNIINMNVLYLNDYIKIFNMLLCLICLICLLHKIIIQIIYKLYK